MSQWPDCRGVQQHHYKRSWILNFIFVTNSNMLMCSKRVCLDAKYACVSKHIQARNMLVCVAWTRALEQGHCLEPPLGTGGGQKLCWNPLRTVPHTRSNTGRPCGLSGRQAGPASAAHAVGARFACAGPSGPRGTVLRPSMRPCERAPATPANG
jgi:hypothetical protein